MTMRSEMCSVLWALVQSTTSYLVVDPADW